MMNSLRRSPGLSISAVLLLALGIGLPGAVFAVIDRVLLDPVPFPKPDQLVWLTDVTAKGDETEPSPGNLLDLATGVRSFAAVAGYYQTRSTVQTATEPRVATIVKASAPFFDVLAAKPEHGRVFRADSTGSAWNFAERLLGGDRVVVLTQKGWKGLFGGDPGVVGKPVLLDGTPFTVLGVLRREDAMLIPEADLVSSWDVRASYVGRRFPNGPPRDFRFVSSVARLRDGVSVEAARAELAAFSANLSRAHPKENGAFTTTLRPLAEEVTARSRRPLLLLFGATLAVFVLAAFSVAALLLSRALSRQRDVAVRSALGASGWNLVSPLLAEGAALALAGAVCGLLVASVSVRLLTLAPWAPARAREASVDLRLVLFAALAALVATLVATAAPAWALLRADLAPVLREGGGSKGASGGLTRARRLLVVTQTAATAVLLVGAALLLGSYARLAAVDTGVSAEGVAILRLSLDKSRYLAGDRAAVFYDDLETRLAALPGVTAVGGVTALPMSTVGVDFMRPCWPEGETAEEARGKGADIRMATPGYFRAIGIPLKAGRLFEKTDGEDAPRVVLVNEALARKAFPLGAVGKRLVIDYQAGAYPYEIVGVVGDTRFAGPRAEPRPEVFIPHAQNPYLDVNVAVKTSAAPWTLTGPIRETVRAMDPAQPVHSIVLMEGLAAEAVAADRFLALLLAALAVSALVLSLAGVAGVLAAEVSQRGRELGIRLALGASPMSVRRTVLGDALGLVLVGGVLGLTAAALLARLLGALLFGVSPLAPWAYAAALLVLAASALVAADGPARRAMRLDPATSLREA